MSDIERAARAVVERGLLRDSVDPATCPYCWYVIPQHSPACAWMALRAALAKNAGNTTPTATGEAVSMDAVRDAWRDSRGCPQWGWDDFREAIRRRALPEAREGKGGDDPRRGEGVEKARAAFYEAARRFAEVIDHRDRVYGLIDGPVFLSAYRALLAAERSDPRRGEDGAAIDAQDPMAEYVAASLAWWLDESPEAERMEGETWERFHRAYYRLPLSVRMGAR